MKLGTVIHDNKFQYDDGTTGNKLAVIVARFGKNFLAVNTTSRQHRKNKIKGCQINDKPPNYYLPKNSMWFNADTWILLDQIFELDINVLSAKNLNQITQTVLPQDVTKELLKCAIKSEDIEEFYLEMLTGAFDSF